MSPEAKTRYPPPLIDRRARPWPPPSSEGAAGAEKKATNDGLAPESLALPREESYLGRRSGKEPQEGDEGGEKEAFLTTSFGDLSAIKM